MVKVGTYIWAVLDVIGMIILSVGAISIIGLTPVINLENNTSIEMMAAGIVLIVVSSFFVYLDGSRLRKELEEFQKFDEIREETRKTPNDLKDGYIIDYTAEPGSAVLFCGAQEEAAGRNVSDADAGIIYL